MNLRRYSGYKILLAATLLIPLGLIGFKIFVLNFPMGDLVPVISYRVDLSMQVDGHGEDINAQTYLPKSDFRQEIGDEQNSSGPFILGLQSQTENRIADWQGLGVSGRQNIVFTFSVKSQPVQYNIPEGLKIPTSYPRLLQGNLQATPGIQVEDPLINETIARLFSDHDPTILEAVTTIHNYLQNQLSNRPFTGYTDALTALKLGEANCNGKSRLFAALARKLNLPTRLKGGLILSQGSKRLTHQWIEIYINGHWVPFDTINNHFAKLPANYLTLYYGDLTLFKHTDDVNFQYFFKMTKRLVPHQQASVGDDSWSMLFIRLFPVFEKVGISQNLLKIILMIPFGALVTAIFRNVIGLQTFGTFLPALIATAMRETGLAWGVFAFLVIILLSALVRKSLDRLQLLHTPKMAILLTVVIIIMMTMTVLGVRWGFIEMAHITLFPIAILTITAERFALIQTEQGFLKAAKILLMTIFSVAACYMVISSIFLQSLVLVFPELLLVVIGMNLWLGRWTGIRVTEYYRFRRLIADSG